MQAIESTRLELIHKVTLFLSDQSIFVVPLAHWTYFIFIWSQIVVSFRQQWARKRPWRKWRSGSRRRSKPPEKAFRNSNTLRAACRICIISWLSPKTKTKRRASSLAISASSPMSTDPKVSHFFYRQILGVNFFLLAEVRFELRFRLD